jgi:hypothetical protein
MNAFLTKSLSLAVVASLSLVFVANSWAQSYLDGSAKARGDYGQMPRISRTVSQPTFQANAPSATRSYSYEPAPAVKANKGDSTNSKAKSSPSAKANTAPNATANNRSTRVYSYEPGMGVSNSNRSSSTPLYLLPKSDARKFGGG